LKNVVIGENEIAVDVPNKHVREQGTKRKFNNNNRRGGNRGERRENS
jgi:hypothetical protein